MDEPRENIFGPMDMSIAQKVLLLHHKSRDGTDDLIDKFFHYL